MDNKQAYLIFYTKTIIALQAKITTLICFGLGFSSYITLQHRKLITDFVTVLVTVYIFLNLSNGVH